MKNFWGPGVPTLLFRAYLKETVTGALRARATLSSITILVATVLFPAARAIAQDTYESAEPITGIFGSVTNDNTGVIAEGGAPTIAGYPANATLWYAWTAPQSGEVEMDTIGSTIDPSLFFGLNYPLDTVMGVYTGNSLTSLSQVAANDDLYPVPQYNETYPESIYHVIPGTNEIAPVLGTNNVGPVDVGYIANGQFQQYYSGPSGLRFNAVGGQTYYIAVDSKAEQFLYVYGNLDINPGSGLPLPNTGPIILNWAYKPSGVFRIATENFDQSGNLASSNSVVPPPLIPTCQTETSFQTEEDFSDHGWTVDAGQYNIQLHSYYPYNVPGVPVTITRVGGSSGRVWLTYSTEDGNTNLILNGDEPAIAGRDYTPETNQTLIFDDGEMSKTIYVPIIDNSVAEGGKWHANRDFTLAITGVQPDPNEDSSGDATSISPPRVDSNFGQTEVRILDVDIDPNGPANTFLITSNMVGTNVLFATNIVWSIEPTNPILNFEKVNYRFPRDVTNYWNSAGKGTLVTIWVTRRGTNTAAVSANWSIDNGYLANGDLGSDYTFPLEPASDYANPNPATLSGLHATNDDFSFSAYGGTVSFPDAQSGHGWDPQPIQFVIYNNGNATLDKDFIVDLFQINQNGTHIPCGMVGQTKVTILANRTPVTGETPADNRLPAGSVDENYNVDFGLKMAPSINTQPQNNPNPGTDLGVEGMVLLPNNETLAVGYFHTYNGVTRNGICLIQTDGTLDQSFNPGLGANVYANGASTGLSVECAALNTNNQQFLIGGSFTSYNGQNTAPVTGEGGVARVNLNGSIDTSFKAGVDGTVYSLAVEPNGQVLIGGNFSYVDGTYCPYVARLNPDGSLDTSFNPGNTLDGPVYTLAAKQTAVITTNVVSNSGTPQENDAVININSNDVGNVTVNYIFPTANDMQVYYGGNLIYDTGLTTTGPTTAGQFTVPYGPGSTPLLLVVNPGGSVPSGTNYSYAAVVTGASIAPEVMVGGDFDVSGQSYTDIALFNTDGTLDTSFNPTFGADAPVHTLDWQPDGKILVGGEFQNFNATPINRFARINADGSLDTTNFFVGTGADDIVFCAKYVNPYTFGTTTSSSGVTNVNVSVNRAIYIGGQFSSYNGTHRLGFARLYTDGTVDTTFMDTTYNQFAGLPKIYANDLNYVHALGVQSDGNVMIGGSFQEVGGGEAEMSPRNQVDLQRGIAESFTNQWLLLSIGGTDVEPNARDGVRNRNNIARLVGGATPGPGNLLLVPDSSSGYSVNRDGVTEPIALVRTNGLLGPESANFSIVPGTAQNGSDLLYQSAPPLYYLAWEYAGPSRMHSDGLQGDSGFLNDAFGYTYSGGLIDASEVNVTILPDRNVAGNLTATYQLANPANADQLYLGGEDIAVGGALGFSSAPVTLNDNSSQAGIFGFASPTFVATNLSPQITIIRTNGAEGNVTLYCSTNSPYPASGTALLGTDYLPFPRTQLPFAIGRLTNAVTLSILNHGIVNTNFAENTVNLVLNGLQLPGGLTGGYGISNATVRLINPNFPGYLTFSATNYYGLEAPPYGEISFTVNRVAGSEGSLSVQYATADGSAVHNVDYVGATNVLQWNSGDVSARTVTLPLINSGVVGTSKQFSVSLLNPQLNNSGDSGLFYPGSPGSITSATMTISNNNSYGTVQLSATNYLVNENGGYATITVVRSGGVAGPAYVDYATADGTAVANANYLPSSGTLTFAPNQLSASFNVTITNNGQFGPNLYFNVNLANPVSLALGTWTNAQVQIQNDQTINQPPGSTNGTFGSAIYGDVLALAYQTNGQIIAAGTFNDVNGLTENNIVRLNTSGSVDTTFGGNVLGTVQTVVNQTDNRVLVGGQFNYVGTSRQNYITRLMIDGTIDSSFDIGSGADGPVYSLAETFIGGLRKIYVGGAFQTVNSGGSAGITRLNNDGTVDLTFNGGLGVDGTVYAVAVYPTNSIYAGDILIGGSFVHYNGSVVNGIARLNPSGALDFSFVCGAGATNGAIKAITIQPDGKVLIGGNFAGFNGSASTNITRLNDDGSVDTNFIANVAPGANNVVEQFVLQQDNRILVVGQFTQFGGLVRNDVTRLLPSGAADPTINFGIGANGAVDSALIASGTGLITLGGGFTQFNGAPAEHIVQLYGLSQTGSGAFEFSSPGYQAAANGVVAPITIVRVGGTSGTNSDGSGNVYVNFSTVTNSGTAVAGVDYLPVSTNVAFPPGAVVETVYVPVLNDFAATNNLNVGLLLTNATPPTIVTNLPTALLTILNVNNGVSFTSAFTNVVESVPGGVANVAVVRQGSTNTACTVDFYTTTNGSAIAGVDFYPTNETITFNPGVSSQTAQVLIISNSTVEKTVSMVLTNPVDTVLDVPTNETLTILNNSTSPGQLCFASTNYTVNESAGTVTVTIVRTNGFAGTVSCGYTTVPGTAQPNANYTPTSGTATFDVNTSYSFTVPITQFAPPEGPVSFSVILTNSPSSTAALIAPTNASVTILDDINSGVSFLNATNYFQETNGSVSVLVQRVGNTNADFSVPFFTTNGSALAGINYVTNSGTLTFTPGESVAGISVTLINNENVSNLNFGVDLLPPGNSVELLAPSNAVVVETPAASGISFTSPTNSVFKNAGSITIPVVCLDPGNEPPILNSNSIPLSVDFATTNGTAVAGVDYVATNGILTFTNGLVTNMITVQVLNNSLITGLRTFSVNLFSNTPVPPSRLVPPTNDVITIIDSNSGLEFSSANYSINSGGIVPITVLRVDSTNGVSTVNYATTSGGSAIPGADYYPTNGVLTFAAGQTSNSFNVTVIGSSSVEPDKTILIALSNPTNGVLSAPSAATLTIFNQNGSYITPAGVSMDPNSPLPNGILQSNQPALLYFGFRDAGGLDVSDLQATLLASGNITSISPASQPYKSLTVNGHSASQEFTFTPVGTNGQTIFANFRLAVTAVNNTTTTQTNSFALTIGSWTTTWSNTNAIVFSGTTNSSPMIASPYPSIINVTNVGGVLVGATVTVTNYSDTSPQANQLLLVSPGLADTLLMSGIGNAQVTASRVTLTFSNCVPINFLPYNTSPSSPITNGVYNPTQYGGITIFP